MNIFLSDDEIKHLTGGLSQPSAQASWLEKNKIPYKLNKKGVVVARYWVEHAPFSAKEEIAQSFSMGSSSPSIGSFGGGHG